MIGCEGEAQEGQVGLHHLSESQRLDFNALFQYGNTARLPEYFFLVNVSYSCSL